MENRNGHGKRKWTWKMEKFIARKTKDKPEPPQECGLRVYTCTHP